ncbi:MAG: ComEA family DNA-binding protein [Chloroflexi bacterium]|nr:ComEA family DNA-binding protein [Chloroflexota bacterium]
MNRWTAAWLLAVGVLIGLLAAGLVLLVSSPPRGEAAHLLPAPTPQPIRVHVTGAAANPGVYALPAGSRVEAAIQAAGGLLPQANAAGLNLAALLEDGQKVEVAFQPPTPTPTSEAAALETPQAALAAEATASPAPASSGGLININTASQAELESLPGIGPALALRIIEYRDAHGPFATTQAIQDVSGIGPATFEKIRALITVGG